MNPELLAHPAADYLPMMDEQRFAELVKDIRANGLYEPIILLDGKILDGRNRYRACIEAGIEPALTQYHGDSPTQFVWSKNCARRDLTPSQRTAIAVEMLPALKEEAKKRQEAGKGADGSGGRGRTKNLEAHGSQGLDDHGRATEEAARIVGVSATQVKRAVIVKEADPNLFDDIKAGKTNVRSAHRQVTETEATGTPRKPQAERAAEIQRLADEGHRARQIAEDIGIGIHQVRNIAKAANITLPDKAIGKTHAIRARRVVEETAHALSGCAIGLESIAGATFDDITKEEAAEWSRTIAVASRSITKLRARLLEHANG